MKKHFYVINKKALALCFIAIVVNMFISVMAIVKLMQGGSRLWLIPIIIFVTFILITMLILIQVTSSGVDVKDNVVIAVDADKPEKGKCALCNLDDIRTVDLQDGEGNSMDLESKSLSGGRVTFILKGGTKRQYYPMYITKRQFEAIRDGIEKLIKERNNEKLFE